MEEPFDKRSFNFSRLDSHRGESHEDGPRMERWGDGEKGESQGCSLSIVFSRRPPVAKSIINSSAEKGAGIQDPSLTPPNSFPATRAASQGVERELGRESQVAATINQISSKLSRLFDRHLPLTSPRPGPLLCRRRLARG